MLVTGGAGFIGVNSALAFAKSGWDVTILDNFSRRGAEANVAWLRGQAHVSVARGDLRDREMLERVFSQARYDAILHLAAQVAVTTSVANPREDFEINALGTLNLLEAMRTMQAQSHLLFASTNKVYGKLEEVAVEERNGRYEYRDLPRGVGEHQRLDFHSPYGCSKGAADQYTLDYGRIYGLKTTCFRQSCIYGPRQFGVEDQGWVAWFVIAAVLGKKITIYGDGKQIRDLLYVDDLVAAYRCAFDRPAACSGAALNIGGGPENTLSLLELVEMLRGRRGIEMPIQFEEWRPGDQPVFVCDLTRARRALEWAPRIGVELGVMRLLEWVSDNKDLFASEDLAVS